MKYTKAEKLREVSSGSRFTKKRILLLCTGLFFSALCFSQNVSAQQLNPMDVAPPPLKILSKPEQKQLDEQLDLKKRTILALELMDLRLKKAEECDARNDFRDMYDQLGGFHALMDYTLTFLSRDKTNKNLGNFKRYEMGLRNFPNRVELIRRELPVQYESYLRELLKNISDARGKAIEPLFGDTVLPNN